MVITRHFVLSVAVACAISSLAACEVDESAPSHPRTSNILTPDSKSNDDAFNRVNEKPQRDLPTSGSEFPGHTLANPPAGGNRVLTADAVATGPDVTAPAPMGAPGASPPASATPSPDASCCAPAPASDKPVPANVTDARFPETRYPENNWYPGPLPHLPEKPGGVMVGSTPVPGTGWAIDHSWGQVLPLADYPHRNWPDTQTTYTAADVKNNPVYFFNLQNRLDVPQNDGTMGGNYINDLYEIPWFCCQTAALPVLMVLQCPHRQVTTQRLGGDPVYFGQLPAAGAIVPSMTPGVIHWEYPFLMPVKEGQQPSFQPIAPTPGIQLPPATATDEPISPPATTPGLK